MINKVEAYGNNHLITNMVLMNMMMLMMLMNLMAIMNIIMEEVAQVSHIPEINCDAIF